jgi:hypothetical protein
MRSRLAIVAALVALCLTAGVAYVGVARQRVDDDIDRANAEAEAFIEDWEGPVYAEGADDPTGSTTSTTFAPFVSERLPFRPGDLVFVNQIPGDEYGRLGLWREDTRIILDLACDRAHASRETLVCLRPASGPAGQRATIEVSSVTSSGFGTAVFGAVGRPSRARVAADGQASAGTVFVSGHSYLDIGQFATATDIFVGTGDERKAHSMETDFTVEGEQPRHRAVDGNWWGVTFGPDGDDFFVTYGSGGATEILRGSVSEQRVRPYLQGVTCPSLSPDGRTIVAKRPIGGGAFEMVAIAVDEGRSVVLPESRSVEDQVEWLDDDTILYALPHEDAADGPQPAMDIWALDIAPGAEPELFLPYAASPGAVH